MCFAELGSATITYCDCAQLRDQPVGKLGWRQACIALSVNTQWRNVSVGATTTGLRRYTITTFHLDSDKVQFQRFCTVLFTTYAQKDRARGWERARPHWGSGCGCGGGTSDCSCQQLLQQVVQCNYWWGAGLNLFLPASRTCDRQTSHSVSRRFCTRGQFNKGVSVSKRAAWGHDEALGSQCWTAVVKMWMLVWANYKPYELNISKEVIPKTQRGTD